jgi:uncharacterized protein YggE
MNNYKNTAVENQNKMILIGKGQVTATPDLAVLRIGVETTNENLTIAQSENARIMQVVLQTLRELGVMDIKTVQYTIDKQYEFVDGNRVDRGYNVRNILEIRISNMDQIGTVIDMAVNSGANVVESIRFEVSEPDFYYNQALNLAVLNAYEKAKSIEETLGITINPIPTLITENSSSVIPFTPMYSLREAMPVTPIEAGNTIIEASVTVEFMYD